MSDFKTKYKTFLEKYGINTKLRYDHFMAQVEVECGFLPKREDGYYKQAATLRKMFKTPFKGKTEAFVESYLRDSKKLFNYVYANRMGNGSVESGDGFKYRAGGMLGITGKDAFFEVSKATGLDIVNNPDLLNVEVNALIVGLWYWNKKGLNKFADLDNIDAISDIINIGSQTKTFGDANHFDKRQKAYEKYKKLAY